MLEAFDNKPQEHSARAFLNNTRPRQRCADLAALQKGRIGFWTLPMAHHQPAIARGPSQRDRSRPRRQLRRHGNHRIAGQFEIWLCDHIHRCQAQGSSPLKQNPCGNIGKSRFNHLRQCAIRQAAQPVIDLCFGRLIGICDLRLIYACQKSFYGKAQGDFNSVLVNRNFRHCRPQFMGAGLSGQTEKPQ